jgi:hypothetical protein
VRAHRRGVTTAGCRGGPRPPRCRRALAPPLPRPRPGEVRAARVTRARRRGTCSPQRYEGGRYTFSLSMLPWPLQCLGWTTDTLLSACVREVVSERVHTTSLPCLALVSQSDSSPGCASTSPAPPILCSVVGVLHRASGGAVGDFQVKAQNLRIAGLTRSLRETQVRLCPPPSRRPSRLLAHCDTETAVTLTLALSLY